MGVVERRVWLHPSRVARTLGRPAAYDRIMPRPRRAESADDILTSPTAARLAGLDRVHFARLIREGKGPRHQTIEAGKRHLVLILRRDLEAWLAARNS